MKRSITILALSMTIGFPSAIAVTEVCSTKFDQAWAKKVKAIVSWNATHKDYVRRHHLNRDMSANTAAMKARMLKQIDLMCEVMDEAGQAGGDVEGHYVDGLRGFVWGDGSERGSDGGLDYLESDYRPLISEKEQVTYEAAERSPEFYGAFGTNPGFPGWVSGGGYLGGTNPPPPMNPVPEPASFGLVGVGLIAAWKVRKG